jgi:uncharacterized protein YjiS (DUF1127 family)
MPTTAWTTKLHRWTAHRFKRARLRAQLQCLDDRLADLGFSRPLSESGVSVWPWREPDNALARAKTRARAEATYAKAAAQLHAYSDRELADLALPRWDIEHAVRHGRPNHPADRR